MTKHKLKQINTLNKMIESKLRQLEALKATYYGLKAVMNDISGVRGSEVSNPTEAAAVRIATLSEEINADIDQLVDLKRDASECIKHLDKKYQLVLELRYMECLSWSDIAKIMGYGIDNIYRLHGQALKSLQ